MDLRITNHAKLLVHYCVRAHKRNCVGITGSPVAEPLLVAICEETIKAGAWPALRMAPDVLTELLFQHGHPHHFSEPSPFTAAFAKAVTSTITVLASSNTQAQTHLSPERHTALAKAHHGLANLMRHKPWTITLHPTHAYAHDAEMSLREFEDFVYGALYADQDDPIRCWEDVRRSQAKLVARLNGADQVRIVGDGTDLTLSVKGRRFVNSYGTRNMPSGEVFAAPVETSAEGHMEFDIPACRDGREVEGVRLVFRKGVVVESSAKKNEAYLKAMLRTDRGSVRLGELGIGTNRKIDRFIRNILFDEKIGGTVHLALGDSPVQTRGKNRSAIHWDLIKDLRHGGRIYVDGKLFQKDGKFIG